MTLLDRLKLYLARKFAAPAPTQTGDLIHGPARRDALGTAYRPFRSFSADGLALAGRDYGDPASPLPPVFCIPGLSRNARDFEPLAGRFARERRVIAIDLRGRGQSEYDDDARHYNPLTEAQDTLLVIDRLGLPKPVLFGTSRGGLIAMTIGALKANPFAGVVMNDIGPVIELDGLLKIKSYVGRTAPPATWDEAVAWVAKLTAPTFPGLDRAAHERMARRIFRDHGGLPMADYDPKLAAGLDLLTPMTVLPEAWPQFATLTGCPMLVLRGEHSDILSAATVQRMAANHPDLETVTVPGQGHVPLLEDASTLDRIAAFLARC